MRGRIDRAVFSVSPVVLGVTAGTWWLAGLPASYPVLAAVVYVALGVLLRANAPEALPSPGIGPANRVTLVRAALAVPILAASVAPFLPVGPAIQIGVVGSPLWWLGVLWVPLLGTGVLVLDGVDGRVARRTGTESAFGARFDMELDAAFLMALSLLVWTSGRAGAWCLLIGLMRYLFVLAGAVWPALRAELPESMRRKVVCVVQGIVLLVGLVPYVPVAVTQALVGGALVLLIWSFAVDVRWSLARTG